MARQTGASDDAVLVGLFAILFGSTDTTRDTSIETRPPATLVTGIFPHPATARGCLLSRVLAGRAAAQSDVIFMLPVTDGARRCQERGQNDSTHALLAI